jgi:RHS repeat-associated protein
VNFRKVFLSVLIFLNFYHCFSQCSNSFEPNNSSSTATTFFSPTLNQTATSRTIQSMITSGDQDWFLIGMDFTGTLTISLTNLPSDYDVELYGSNGLSSLLTGSYNTGVGTEQIIFKHNTPASTFWYVKVYGKASSNFSSTQCYTLTISWVPCSINYLTPTLNSPGTNSFPGSNVSSLTPTLDWQDIAGATSYGVYIRQMNADGSLGPLIYDQNCITSTSSFSVPSGILQPNTRYRWNVVGFIGCGSCQTNFPSPLYFVTSNGCQAPTTPASNIFFTNLQSNQVTVNWSIGNGTRRVVRINNLLQFSVIPDGTDPSANSTYQGIFNQVVYNGSGNSVTITNLQPSTTYFINVTEVNCTGGSTVYLNSGGFNNPNSFTTPSICTTPTNQASSISFSNNDGISVTANWNNGNGTARIVKVNTTNSFSNPINGVPPTNVDISYQNNGEQTVYYGSGNNVYVNQLTPGQGYFFRVYEANCTGNQIVYNTGTNTGNPGFVTMIGGQLPIANFDANIRTINTGQSIQFIDLSSNATQWQWRFYRSGVQGGQQQIGSTLTTQNPQVAFSTAGCYRIELTAINSNGTDIEVKDCFVYVKPNPSATVPADVAMSLQYNTYFGGDPVNTALGFFSFQQSDISTKGINTNLSIERRYASRITASGQFGLGWYFDYGMKLFTGEYDVTLIKGDGSAFVFNLYPNGEARCASPIFNDSLYYINNAGVFTYTYIEKNGCKWIFDNSGLLVGKIDLYGNTTQIIRSGAIIEKIIVPGGRELNFTYNANTKISSIRNGIDTAFYFYNLSGELLDSVRIRNSRTWYKYVGTSNYLEEIISPNNHRIIKNEYTSDKVTKQWDVFDILTQFQYDTPIPGSTTILNGLDKTKVLSHDASYLITKQVNEIGGVRRYSHTSDHHLDSLIDERANSYKFYTELNGDVVKSIDPLLNVDSIYYSSFGKPTYIRDKENNVTQIAYSLQFNPIQITQANNGIHTILYDQFGQDTTIIDPLNNRISKKYSVYGDLTKVIREHSADSMQYDAIGRPIVRINARSFADSIQYNHYSQPTRITDASGYAETFEYDANGNLINHTDKEGTPTIYTYDAKDRLLQIFRAGIIHKEYVWNELDFLIRVRDGNRNCLIITNDDLGRPTHIADSVLGVVAEYSYDVAGNRITSKNSLGNIWTYRYDELNRLVASTNPNNDSTIIKYNKNNQPTELIDEEGKSTRLFYNSIGTHIKTIDKNNASIQIFPNLIGLPDSIRDARGFYRNITYDGEYRIKTYNDGYGNHQYSYDSVGNIIEYRDLASNILTWTYNERNEKTQEKWSGAIKKEFSYNKNGWLTYATNQGVTLNKWYNSNGWVIKDSATFSGATIYKRDSVGNLKKTSLRDGKEISYTYNSLNYNTSVKDWNNQTFILNRDKEGSVTSFVYPNNTHTSVTRNTAYQVTAWVNSKTSPAEIFQKNNPVYTRRSEVSGDTSTINYFPKNSILAGSYRATYLAADRKGKYGTTFYTYNGNGSVINITDSSSFTSTFSYNPDNSTQHVVLNGNQFEQTYNAFNHRVQKNNASVNNRFSLSYEFASHPIVLQDLSTDNNTLATNLFSPDGILLARDSAGFLKYYHYSAYGNTTALTNATGEITDTYAYPLFGNAFTHKGSSTQPYTWQGMSGVQNDTNGIYYIWQRFYDANTGTFLSKDPIQGALSDTRSLNSYLYGLNDPLSFSDPNGLKPVSVNEGWINKFQNVFDYQNKWLNFIPGSWFAQGIGANAYANELIRQSDIARQQGNYQVALDLANQAIGVANSGINRTIQGSISDVAGLLVPRILFGSTSVEIQGYNSFNAFKSANGPAGVGNAWHHIVEQHSGNVARFGAESIHNTRNIIKLPHGAGTIHAKVTGYYNSLMPGTSLRVRDYVKTLSYEQQYQYGIDILKRFGWTQ